MKAIIFVLAAILIALIVTWIVLRLARPDVAKRLGKAILAAGAAVGGALITVLTLGRRKPAAQPAAIDPKKDLQDAASKYETEDNFEDFAHADTGDLDPAPPDRPLDVELSDFRAGSADLLGDGHDPG